MDDQLIPAVDFAKDLARADDDRWLAITLTSDDGSDVIDYYVYFERFKVVQYTNGEATVVVNPIDSLYVETDKKDSLSDEPVPPTCETTYDEIVGTS